MTKREIVDRIREIDAAIHEIDVENAIVQQRRVMLDEERAMLLELLDEWPDGAQTLAALRGEVDSEPPITEPGTPRTKSSQRMAAVTLPPEEAVPCAFCEGLGKTGRGIDAIDCAACGGSGLRRTQK